MNKHWIVALAMGTAAAGCEGVDLAGTDLDVGTPDLSQNVAAVTAAGVDLVALGTLDGHGADLSEETAAPLENGRPGNLLGGLGSALAYGGNDTYYALPDRGPNAV